MLLWWFPKKSVRASPIVLSYKGFLICVHILGMVTFWPCFLITRSLLSTLPSNPRLPSNSTTSSLDCRSSSLSHISPSIKLFSPAWSGCWQRRFFPLEQVDPFSSYQSFILKEGPHDHKSLISAVDISCISRYWHIYPFLLKPFPLTGSTEEKTKLNTFQVSSGCILVPTLKSSRCNNQRVWKALTVSLQCPVPKAWPKTKRP